MADTKISGLPASTTPLAGTEVLPIVQGGVTKQVSVANLTAGRAVATAGGAFSDNLIQGVAGKGVNYTANTPAAGMTGQLLNWYEEGTWTPSIGGDATYTFREGFYTRIGRLITVSGIIVVNSIGTGSTTQISGIPFNVAQNGSGSSSYFENLATSVVSLVPYGDNGAANVLKFRALTAAATTMSGPAIFQNGTRVDFTVTYIA